MNILLANGNIVLPYREICAMILSSNCLWYCFLIRTRECEINMKSYNCPCLRYHAISCRDRIFCTSVCYQRANRSVGVISFLFAHTRTMFHYCLVVQFERRSVVKCSTASSQHGLPKSPNFRKFIKQLERESDKDVSICRNLLESQSNALTLRNYPDRLVFYSDKIFRIIDPLKLMTPQF
jgi:hypothetical protein